MNTQKRRSTQAEAWSRRLQRQQDHERRVAQARTHRAQNLFNGLVLGNGPVVEPAVVRAQLAEQTGFSEDIIQLWVTTTVPEFVHERLIEAVHRLGLERPEVELMSHLEQPQGVS